MFTDRSVLGAIAQANNSALQNQYAGLQQAKPPPTLNGAMSSLDELNNKLAELRDAVSGLAQNIGGPFPAVNYAGGNVEKSMSAIARLNDQVQESHRTATDIKQSVDAIARALGG